MSFHYFLPGHPLPKTMGAVDLDLAKYGVGLSLADIKKAPDDATAYAITINSVEGLFVTPHIDGASPRVVTYQPDKQTWIFTDISDVGAVGIGWETDSPPNPIALRRPTQIIGLSTPDASKNEWIIPIARAGGRNGITLPCDFDFDPITYAAIERPNSDYESLWAISGELWDHWNSVEFTLPPAKLAEYALAALAVNYRVGPLELQALRMAGRKVIDATSAALFGLALIDWQMADEFKKKPAT